MYGLFFLKFREKQAFIDYIVRSLFYIAFRLLFWYDTTNLRFGGSVCAAGGLLGGIL